MEDLMKNGFLNAGEGAIWWMAVPIIAVLLIIGGVELNPGPTHNAKVTLQDLHGKLNEITEILGTHTNETKKKLEDIDLKWSGLKTEVEHIKSDITNLKESLNEHRWLDRNSRKHNLIVYGFNESANESRWDLCYALLDLFAKELQVNISDNMIDDCFRMGKSKKRRLALIRFTSILLRDSVLEREKLLKGT